MTNFKYIFALFLAGMIALSAISSCSGKDDTYYDSVGSHDAQLYNFALRVAILYNELPADSARWNVVNKTKFMIDQKTRTIFNPDSLPYGLKLGKVLPVFSYSPTGGIPQTISFVYSDTSVYYNGRDSIDFTKTPKTISVISSNLLNIINYTIDIRTHQIDLDLMRWNNFSTLPSNIQNQKTILNDGMLYCYATDGTSTTLYKLNPTLEQWTYTPVSTDIPNNVLLSSMLVWKDNIYAVDNAGSVYVSNTVDGTSWSVMPNATYIHNILGVLPGKTEDDDVLLATIKDAGTPILATTKDMLSFIRHDEYAVPANAPSEDFSPVTIYNRENALTNMLTVTGGTSLSGNISNLTWLYLLDDEGTLKIASNQENCGISRELEVTTFPYDGKLYAISGLDLYESSSWGAQWHRAADNQKMDMSMKGGFNQSIVVDENNHIWVLGGINNMSFMPGVWRGIINKYIE